MKTRNLLITFGVLFTTFGFLKSSHGSDIKGCIVNSVRLEHRIDRMDSLRGCFDNFKKNLISDVCLTAVNQNIRGKYSGRFEDELRSICLYETSGMKDIKSCEGQASRFRDSYNHDDAIFFCFQQFQEKLTKNDCLASAKKMIFPLKRDYLKQHCLDNYSE